MEIFTCFSESETITGELSICTQMLNAVSVFD